MKTTLMIIAAFGIQISTLFAGNLNEKNTPIDPLDLFCVECPILVPKVPLEAPFVEMTEFFKLINLIPVVPGEASFDDEMEFGFVANNLTPIVPLKADFTDSEDSPVFECDTLAPVVPETADFIDSI